MKRIGTSLRSAFFKSYFIEYFFPLLYKERDRVRFKFKRKRPDRIRNLSGQLKNYLYNIQIKNSK